jgi:hypothetical protein
MATIAKKKTNNISNLYGYVLWCNTIESTGPTWYAIPRDQELLFFNGNKKNTKGVLSNKGVNKLITEIKQIN